MGQLVTWSAPPDERPTSVFLHDQLLSVALGTPAVEEEQHENT